MFEEFNSKNEPEDAFAAFTQEPIKPKKEKKPRPTSYPGRYQPVNVQMSAENQDFLNLIDEMLEFARNNERFDPGTTLSIRESATEKGHVTVNQYNALVHVYYAFKMDRKQEPQPTV